MPVPPILDWDGLTGLKLRARVLADGAFSGAHASARRGLGLEFAGHRPYVAGDDLRWLDPRGSLRTGSLLVRQFETETERALHLIIDASASMAFRSASAPASKWRYASTLAAALARIAQRSGDPTGLTIWGPKPRHLAPARGTLAHERLLAEFEAAEPDADARAESKTALRRAVASALDGARRGTLMVVLSDLLEQDESAPRELSALGAAGRQLCVCQVLDKAEAALDFDRPARFKSPETGKVVQTDPAAARARYRAALEALQARYRVEIESHGGHLLVVQTDADPVAELRRLLGAISGSSAKGEER